MVKKEQQLSLFNKPAKQKPAPAKPIGPVMEEDGITWEELCRRAEEEDD